MSVHRVLQPQPGAGFLLVLPERHEPIEEKLAPRVQLHRQHVEAAVGRPVRGLRGETRVQVRRTTGPATHVRDILALESVQVLAHAWKHHVAVVHLAEEVL